MMGHVREVRVDDGRPWDGVETDLEPVPALPEREWGLSALQTAGIVAAILVTCEVIALLG